MSIDKAATDGLNNSSKGQHSSWHIIRRVIPYLWPSKNRAIKRRVVLSLFALVCAKLIAVSTPFFYKSTVDALTSEPVSPEWLMALGTIGLTVAYGLTRLMGILFKELRDVIFSKVGQQALRSLAFETITHIHKLSMRYHISRKTGGLSRVIERGVKGIDFLLRFLLFSIGPLILELLMISIILVVAFDAWYLFIVTATVVSYVTFTTRVTQWRLKIRKNMNDQDKDANQKAIDGLLNFETVKYFGAQEKEANRYDHSMSKYEKAAIKSVQSLALLNVGQAFIVNAGLVASLALAAYDVTEGRLTVGDFVMVNAYMMQVMLPLGVLGFVYREIRQALVDMSEMFQLLEQPPEVVDRESAPQLQIRRGAIWFRDIYFSYDKSRSILSGVDIKVEAGQTVAIVGVSGSGKSTLGRLLFRFYDVVQGSVSIDGQDVRDVTQQSLQANIGVVPQDTVLFNDSILYNISYGRPEASFSEIEQAAKAAKIHSFILQLPQQYDTVVGERGLKLSGGEKQRVGIARTLLKNAPILLLDEATSALDTQTERDIQQSLQKMGRGRTVITIAHRLSTVVEADNIIVLDGGVVVEQGSHQALMLKKQRYFTMWQSQLKQEDKESAYP